MADRSLSRQRTPKPPDKAIAAGAAAVSKAAAAPALPKALQPVVCLLACVVRARGRLNEAEARQLLRHELPGKAFALAQAIAVDSGYLLGLDGMCLAVTARGRALPGVMPPTARVVRMVEGASWEHPDGPPVHAALAEAPTVYAIPAGADLLGSIPKGLVRAHLAGRVSGGEFERLSSAPREVIVRGSDVTVRAVKGTKPAAAKASPQVALKPTPTPQALAKAPGFTLAPRTGAGRAVATARRARRSHA